MLASVPESEPLVSPRNRRSRAYQSAAEPESAELLLRSHYLVQQVELALV